MIAAILSMLLLTTGVVFVRALTFRSPLDVELAELLHEVGIDRLRARLAVAPAAVSSVATPWSSHRVSIEIEGATVELLAYHNEPVAATLLREVRWIGGLGWAVVVDGPRGARRLLGWKVDVRWHDRPGSGWQTTGPSPFS